MASSLLVPSYRSVANGGETRSVQPNIALASPWHSHQPQPPHAAAAAASPYNGSGGVIDGRPHDGRYYASCYVAGGLSSGIRWVLSPLELVKTRLQAAPAAVAAVGATAATMSGTFRAIYLQEGAEGLFRGLGPTAVAYWFQTSTKYGLYEVFKDQLLARTTTSDRGGNYSKGLIYVAAAATAEAVADVLMSPWEMLKVKLQTGATTGGNFPSRFGPALAEMVRHRRRYNFPFGSLGPLWGRQIPGTIVNFYTFENAVAAIYANGGKPKEDYTAAQQLGVTVAAGYAAGVCCAVVSHPADSIISLQSLPEHAGKGALRIAGDVGAYRLFTKGLAPRILVTGQIISVQWLLYDGFKSFLGFGTTGGNA